MIPDNFRKLASTCVLWGAVGGGVAVITAVHACQPAISRFGSAAPGDSLPGALRRPTTDELEVARRAWMRRKFGSEIHGPTPQDVADYHNRNHLGATTPPDAVGPAE